MSSTTTFTARVREIILAECAPCTPMPVSSEFALREKAMQRGTLRLTYEAWELPILGELRLTSILGTGTDIYALMIFPKDALHVPVFASETVIFGGRIRVGVVDLQHADPAAPLNSLPRFAPRTNVREEDVPEWCQGTFTEDAVFLMNVGMEELPALEEELLLRLRAWIRHARARSEGAGGSLSLYKEHHIIHTPGRPFLTRIFGEVWTERFLRGGMYR